MAKSQPGLRGIGESVAAITEPIYADRGFVNAELLSAWPRVVGAELAASCTPIRVKFPVRGGPGVLHVHLATSALATVLQHEEPKIIERINTFYGYRAIDRLHYRHAAAGPISADVKLVPAGRATESEPAPDPQIDDVADGDLRETLRALGAALKPKPAGNKSR